MRHRWVKDTLWDCAALKCDHCGLHIVDCEMPAMIQVGDRLWIDSSAAFPDAPPAKRPKGKVLRSQVSNVLNYGFTDRTRKEIITYAEDKHNKACQGPSKPGEGYACWLDDEDEPAVACKPVKSTKVVSEARKPTKRKKRA